MRKISMQEAREIAFKAMDRAEAERIKYAEEESKRGIQYIDENDSPFDLFALDNDIEPNIAPVVKELRDVGLDTFTSCDGGDGHAFKMPTIRISHKNWFIKNENDFLCIYHPRKLLNINEFSPSPMDILQKVYDFVVEKNYFADVILNLSLEVREDGKICINPMIQITFPFGIVKRTKG